MTSVPIPKQRPYNQEHDNTIRVGEYPLAMGLASHLVMTGRDPGGKQLWEFNGLATGPNNQPRTVGLPWDNSDTIKIHFTLGADGRHGHKLRKQRAVLLGSLDDINDFRRQADPTSGLINHLNLDYRFDTQNSNAAAAEILRAGGVDPNVLFRNDGFDGALPGFQHRLLKPGLY